MSLGGVPLRGVKEGVRSRPLTWCITGEAEIAIRVELDTKDILSRSGNRVDLIEQLPIAQTTDRVATWSALDEAEGTDVVVPSTE